MRTKCEHRLVCLCVWGLHRHQWLWFGSLETRPERQFLQPVLFEITIYLVVLSTVPTHIHNSILFYEHTNNNFSFTIRNCVASGEKQKIIICLYKYIYFNDWTVTVTLTVCMYVMRCQDCLLASISIMNFFWPKILLYILGNLQYGYCLFNCWIFVAYAHFCMFTKPLSIPTMQINTFSLRPYLYIYTLCL